jgi:glycosyltransferase involved in cell wall biosynthesis
MSPPVTVLMSAFNCEEFISASIESILQQTYSDFEFLIVDDGSTDRTPDIIANFRRRDSRISCIRNAQNIGLALSLNRGLAVASGDLVARMDADDLSHPSRIELQVEALNSSSKCTYVTTEVGVIDQEGNESSSGRRPGIESLFHWYLHFYNYVGGHGLGMYRKEAVISCGGYRQLPWARYCEDYELWTRLIQPKAVIFLPMKLLLYRRHPAAIGIQFETDQIGNVVETASKFQGELLKQEIAYELAHDSYVYWTRPELRHLLWPRLREHLHKMLDAYLSVHVTLTERADIETRIRSEFATPGRK